MNRGGGASSALTRKVLEVYGDTCHLCRKPGANSKDHLIPFSHGGTDDIGNLRPAHRTCNSKRGNRALGGIGADIRVVMGPPCSGKSTHVLSAASPADIIVDLDRIARAIMPDAPDGRTHVYPPHTWHVAIGARAAVIDRATRLTGTGATVWIIHADPSPDDLDLYRFLRYQVTVLDPGREVVEARVRAERPPHMWRYVSKWYSRHTTPAAEASRALALASSSTTTHALPADDSTPDW